MKKLNKEKGKTAVKKEKQERAVAEKPSALVKKHDFPEVPEVL